MGAGIIKDISYPFYLILLIVWLTEECKIYSVILKAANTVIIWMRQTFGEDT